MSDQQIDDMETIIGQQEEELDQLQDTVGALTEERDDYHAVLSMVVADAERYAHGWLITNASFNRMTDVLTRWTE